MPPAIQAVAYKFSLNNTGISFNTISLKTPPKQPDIVPSAIHTKGCKLHAIPLFIAKIVTRLNPKVSIQKNIFLSLSSLL